MSLIKPENSSQFMAGLDVVPFCVKGKIVHVFKGPVSAVHHIQLKPYFYLLRLKPVLIIVSIYIFFKA